jgi:long-chain acyl-CoA synthetase
MMCGGAVLSGETQRFVQAALCVTLFQGYGLTETCAAATIADRLYLFEKISILKNLIF